MNPLVQQQAQDTEPTPGMAFQYIGQLISEYMKTLPDPVRAPVIAMVNQSNEILGQALNELAKLKQEKMNTEETKSEEGKEEE